jgi:hypothetical protein
LRGQFYRWNGLRMGWSVSLPFHCCRPTETSARHFRITDPASSLSHNQHTQHYLKRKRWRRAKRVPYVGNFRFFAVGTLLAKKCFIDTCPASLSGEYMRVFCREKTSRTGQALDLSAGAHVLYFPKPSVQGFPRAANHADRSCRYLV